jgi:hypothetical protein
LDVEDKRGAVARGRKKLKMRRKRKNYKCR